MRAFATVAFAEGFSVGHEHWYPPGEVGDEENGSQLVRVFGVVW